MKHLVRFEHKTQPLASRRLFLRRLGINLMAAIAIVVPSLAIGMAGYMVFEGRGWVDAYDSAAMILSGMGPFSEASTTAGRIFEGTYAIYSGLTVVAVASLILAPIFHRVLHSFHVPDDAEAEGGAPRPPTKGKPGAHRHE